MNARKRDEVPDPDAVRLRGWIDLAIGLALLAIGVIAVALSFSIGAASSSARVGGYFAAATGGATALRGAWRLARATSAPLQPAWTGVGYKSFVAWRYLLVERTKVSRFAKRWVSVGAAAMIGLAVLIALDVGVRADGKNPLWEIMQAAALFTLSGFVVGMMRHSKIALWVFIVGVGLSVTAAVVMWIIVRGRPPELLEPRQTLALQILNVVMIIGGALAGLAVFFGGLRAFFTFFTTVPIGGVWIGTMALVVVLSVMSGFESDLRQKILGSNAHLQITREDGDFVDWREIKARIDKMPRVVASTPFAVSEVVVAANNTGMPVIIKGIDPKTVGNVTDLVSDLDDPEAMKRLEPITTTGHDLRVPQAPRSGAVIDPPPDDMPVPGEPIDFTVSEPPGAGSGARDDAQDAKGSDAHDGAHDGSAAPKRAAGSGAEDDYLVERTPFGGDARAMIGSADKSLDALANELDDAAGNAKPARKPAPEAVIDPPPDDLLVAEDAPTDYSKPESSLDAAIKVVDVPFDSPSLSRRTQLLPGVLVGRELVKQTHLYTGEEVRVVSPLSDPSNPDATGTPIPFNRDYRVAGIFFTGMYEYDLKYIYVTIDSLQDFLDRGDAIDGIEVRISNPDDTDVVVPQFQAALGKSYRVQDWKELNRSLFSALKLEKVVMFLVLGIVILVASFAIIGNLIMVVVEKQRENALLKTLGASDIGVMQMFAIQGLMIGLIGTVLGVGAGLLLCWGIQRFGLPLNPDVYYIDRLPIHIDPTSVLAAASAGVLISIAATLYPAMVAARVRPAAGMRH